MPLKVIPFSIQDDASRLRAKAGFDGNLCFGGKEFHTATKRSTKDMPASGAMHREQQLIITDTEQERYQCLDGAFEDIASCPVCGHTNRTFFLHRYGLDVYTCDRCSHGFTSPRPTFETASQLYSQDRTASEIYTSPMQVEIDEVKALYGLELLRQSGIDTPDRILDFGCGSGTFLKTALREGWKSCVGIDANPRYKESSKDGNGLRFIYSTFEHLDSQILGEEFDAITMWNVLEHLYDLPDILSALKNKLKTNGLLLIMVPNLKSLASQIIRERSATFSWKHPHHFTPESLRYLMQSLSLECVHFETAITEIDNIKSALNGQWPYSGYGDPENLYGFITPEFIHHNMLGSRLIGLFRKNEK